jgi:hypothetical protein
MSNRYYLVSQATGDIHPGQPPLNDQWKGVRNG